MTNTVPYVVGSHSRRRHVAAALALLETSPAGTEIVLIERPRTGLQVQRDIASRLASITRPRPDLAARTMVDRETGMVLGLLSKRPVTVENVQEPAPVVPQILYTDTETLNQVEESRSRNRSTKRNRTVAALNRVIAKDGRWETITSSGVLGKTEDEVDEIKRRLNLRRGSLQLMAKKAGFRVTTKIVDSGRNLRLDARLAKD